MKLLLAIDISKYMDAAQESVITFAPKIIIAILIVWIGMKVITKILDVLSKLFAKTGLSESIRPFILSILGVVMKISMFLAAAGVVGVDLSIFVGIIAAATFAIGMALQGSLGNLASGIIILVNKPYHVGDWIDIDGRFGKVLEIQIFNTIIETPGHKTLIVPNGIITGTIVTNYSKLGYIRLKLNVTMPYEESFPKVKKVIEDAMQGLPHILEEPKAEIGIETYDTHFIVLTVRPYCEPDYFWDVTYSVHESIKNAFHQHGIKVAYSEGVEIGSIGA